ncbi:trimethyllysine dioxygenase [Aspergillus sclerotialis]|uniref:Trimethyllysine dioxygenase n=1 Tax=Aspergillus sclerotialis TaxID=2070753 RepID=A0A3A2ZT12_9EURO|nr:trimethyllysine dioxygenase [Aspergillus sclerotialis]
MNSLFQVPKDINAKKIAYEAEHAEVHWSDGHRGLYPFDWLIAHQNPTNLTPRKYHEEVELREYKFHDPANKDYPTVPFEAVMSQDRGLSEWLENIQTWGFCFVEGVPLSPEATQALIERIAFIRHTHYGGFWDFTADMTFKDTAYTTEFLGGHTDNTYFTDPARLQLFHLLSHTDGSGGESLLIDGIEAAARLKKQAPGHVAALSNIRQPAHSSGNQDVCIQPVHQFPVLNIDPETLRLYQVRWNNYDRGARQYWGIESQEEWYDAAREYNNILNSPQMQIWTQLKPGTALIFDNWRMLHGRAEFTGKRRMCGGYGMVSFYDIVHLKQL